MQGEYIYHCVTENFVCQIMFGSTVLNKRIYFVSNCIIIKGENFLLRIVRSLCVFDTSTLNTKCILVLLYDFRQISFF